MSRDPARTTLARVLADAEGRIESATNNLARFIAGECGWNDERVRQHRSILAHALAEREAATRTLAIFDQLDKAAT